MFRRRHPRPLWQRLQGWIWPHIGWRRAGAYVVARVKRMPGTPHSIAAGFACGTAISFTPFVGLHLIGALGLALLVRGNYIAAWVGTLVGNPWTFPFIWIFTYQLGQFLLGHDVASHPDVISGWTFDYLKQEIGRVIWPMTVGGVPTGILAGLAVYFPMARGIAGFQEARRRRREQRKIKRRVVRVKVPGRPTTGAA